MNKKLDVSTKLWKKFRKHRDMLCEAKGLEGPQRNINNNEVLRRLFNLAKKYPNDFLGNNRYYTN